jgi:amylosucrase
MNALSGSAMELLPIEGSRILAYRRWNESDYLLVIANFSGHQQTVDLKPLRSLGLGHFFKDVISETIVSSKDGFTLTPHQFLWLTKD